MTFSEAIKGGFSLINKRWQLVAVQIGMILINCFVLFIMVGIPLVIALILFGLDLTSLVEKRELLGMLQNPSYLFTKYLGLMLIIASSILLYILFATTLWLYVYSGTAGMIGRSLLEPSLKFSMSAFFSEANFPLMWFFLIVSLVFLGIILIIGLFGGGTAALVSIAKSQDSTLALFLGIFFSSVILLISLSMIFVALAVTMYGIAALFFKKEGAIKAFKDAVSFLWNSQHALWLYILLVVCYVLASIIMMFITYPFQIVPVVGTIFSLPLQILSSIVQTYLSLVLTAVIFVYYFDSEIKGPEPVPMEPAGTTNGSSTISGRTSEPQASRQEDALSPEGDQGQT
jgi:hypothetical protein